MDFALVELTSANGISGATVYGDLDLHQRVPMTGRSFFYFVSVKITMPV